MSVGRRGLHSKVADFTGLVTFEKECFSIDIDLQMTLIFK